MVTVELTNEAMNCLKFWQKHFMYGGTPSAVIVRQMEEWLMRDMQTYTNERIEKEFKRIKKGQ